MGFVRRGVVARLRGMSAASPLHVLEYIRHQDGIWDLPAEYVDSLRREFPQVRFSSPANNAACDALLPEADIVLGWAVRPDNFAPARRLKWIQVTAAGVGGLLFPELVASDVIVTNGRGLHAVSMAEHTLGVMLMFVRKLHLARDAQRERVWNQDAQWATPPPFRDLGGTTMALVGLGAVGSAIATRAQALGVRVIAVRRHPAADPAPADAQWGNERLDEAVAAADWVVLAAPLTPDTRGLFDRARLARLQPGAVLVNLGRGALVDEAALIEALAEHRFAGAALDVFENEPLDTRSPLWSMPHVIVTPHVSGFGPRYWERGMELFRRNLHAWNAGRPLENLVDKQAGY